MNLDTFWTILVKNAFRKAILQIFKLFCLNIAGRGKQRNT